MSEKRIAIIEDDPFIGKYLTIILRKNGYSPLSIVDNATAAIRLFENEKPDLLLTDFNLSESSSSQRNEALSLYKTANIPVVVFSSHDKDFLTKSFPSFIPDAILCKPSTVDEICSTIGFCLTKSEFIKNSQQNISEPFYNYPIPINEVLYIRQKQKGFQIRTHSSSIDLDSDPEVFLQHFPPNQFFAINANTWVNLAHVKTMTSSLIYTENEVLNFDFSFVRKWLFNERNSR